MPSQTALVTGCSGLIGSEVVTFFDDRGWTVHGVDNNMRRDFFGPDGDTTLEPGAAAPATRAASTHHDLDIRDRAAMVGVVVAEVRPDADRPRGRRSPRTTWRQAAPSTTSTSTPSAR